MKRTLMLMAMMAWCTQMVSAAVTYTELSKEQCDTENKVIYDGKGRFSVKSAAETEIEVGVNMNSLHSYVNSNDYKSGSPLMQWETNAVSYGLADIADMSKATGEREPEICFYWAGNVWKPELKIDYATLKKHEVDGEVALVLRNSKTNGVTVSAKMANGDEAELLRAEGLKSAKIQQTNAYTVNLNYVVAVRVISESTLDTEGYTPPADYTVPFNSKRTDGKTVGRIMFIGDSITHGVNDQTWRWQFFKILVDNGIEADIVGPRDGYTPRYTNMTTSDKGDSYGAVDFPNVHLAQSSGRTHNIISGSNAGMSGVNYGGHSTKSAADTFNCNTWCCMMGTNDLLSDGGYTAEDFSRKIQNVLGGKVSGRKGKYGRRANNEWGNMGQIAKNVLREDDDILYVMAVPCWGNHHNNNEADRHTTVHNYNLLLADWVKQYSKKHGKKLEYVNVNIGMVDPTLEVPFSWPDSMSNRPGVDGLHPNEQGSMIIAGNLARVMGIGGRTAGLPRAVATGEGWEKNSGKKFASFKSSTEKEVAKDAFTEDDGYTVEINASVGNGAKGGWKSHDKALRITVADGTNSGTLNLSESGIIWGDKVLYCGNNAKTEPVRVVWHPGKAEHNVARGYYVWVGDMLVGQGLPAGEAAGTNGVTIKADGVDAKVMSASWANKAYAPTTKGKSK